MSEHWIKTDAERYQDCEPAQGGYVHSHRCACKGTGRVLREGIDPDAKPEIETKELFTGWYWRRVGDTVWLAIPPLGYDTQADALAAARKALRPTETG